MEKERIEILLKEYDHRFDEVKFYGNKYNQQSNNINILLTLVIALFTAIVSNWEKIRTFENVQLLILFILTFILILTNYFYSLQNDSLAMTYINGIRISYLERKINKITKDNLLMWDHSIIKSYHSNNKLFINKYWVKPSNVTWIWSMFIMVFIYILLGVLCFLYADYFNCFLMLEIIFGLFYILQARALKTKGVEYMVKLVYEKSNVEKKSKVKSQKRRKNIKKNSR